MAGEWAALFGRQVPRSGVVKSAEVRGAHSPGGGVTGARWFREPRGRFANFGRALVEEESPRGPERRRRQGRVLARASQNMSRTIGVRVTGLPLQRNGLRGWKLTEGAGRKGIGGESN